MPAAPREKYPTKERHGRTSKESSFDWRKMQGPHVEDDPDFELIELKKLCRADRA